MEDTVMLLCDVGNTSFHFQDGSNDYKESTSTFNPKTITKKVYYICVNPDVKKLLADLDNWIDISSFIDMNNYYETMGIDRIVACEGIQNGVIIDAGSAITVDVVKNGVFSGGFIYPGTKAMSETYTKISSALDYEFNYNLDLDIMPKNSQDAISYGYLKLLYIEVMSHNMEVIITGGDAKKLQHIFHDAKIDNELLFNSMKKIIKKANLC